MEIRYQLAAAHTRTLIHYLNHADIMEYVIHVNYLALYEAAEA